MEPTGTSNARPLRRHGEDLVRHGDAVEEEERARDRSDLPGNFAWRRRLVAVETPAYEQDARVAIVARGGAATPAAQPPRTCPMAS